MRGALTRIKARRRMRADNGAMKEPNPGAALTRADIERLVDAFYDKVQADPILDPVFNPAVHDWPAHKATLVRFWSSVVLGTREYRGNPMAAHRPHPIVDEHFGHWLALWRQTAHEVMDEADAELMYLHAQRIARSLRLGLGLSGRRPLPMHPQA